jgi:hypothetical protein
MHKANKQFPHFNKLAHPPIQVTSSLCSIFINEEKQYITVAIVGNQSDCFLVEVRAIANLSKIITRMNVSKDINIFDISNFDIDFLPNNKLIVHTRLVMNIIDFQPQPFSID